MKKILTFLSRNILTFEIKGFFNKTLKIIRDSVGFAFVLEYKLNKKV